MARRVQTDPNQAIGYVRVSTDRQDLGPQAQRAALATWAAQRGVTLVAVFEDRGVSGATPADERPGLLAALQDIRDRRVGWLVAAKRDRLARDVVVAATIEALAGKAGAQVATADGVSTDATPEGRLMRTLLDAFAQYERGVIAARTRGALQAKRRRQERTSGIAPYGFEHRDGRLVLVAAEQRAIEHAAQLRHDGQTFAAIAVALAAAGYPPRGKCWRPEGVFRMLARQEAA